MSRVFCAVTSEFLNADLDVFVIDSTKEARDIEALKTLLPFAVQNGATLLEAAEVITDDNVLRMKRQLAEIDERKAQIQAEQAKMEQDAKAQLQQMQLDAQAEQNRITEEDSIRRAETQISVALINADSKESAAEGIGEDTNDNGIRDQIDLMKLKLQNDKQRIDAKHKEAQLAEQSRAAKVAERQKEQEIAIKRKVANKPVVKSK
jgi:hypothetical protein